MDVYRRINPDDWDDDGVENDLDEEPTVYDEDGFGPHQELPQDARTNFYYWADLVVSSGNALVEFEEAYTNMPGVVVPRQSTDVEVSYYVYGGTNGGTYAFTLLNGSRLELVSGGTLPVTGHVAAAESRTITARYRGRLPSASENDVEAVATFVEDVTARTLPAARDQMTTVKIELESKYAASENTCKQRHVYVRCIGRFIDESNAEWALKATMDKGLVVQKLEHELDSNGKKLASQQLDNADRKMLMTLIESNQKALAEARAVWETTIRAYREVWDSAILFQGN